MRPAAPLILLALAAVLLGGCGGSSSDSSTSPAASPPAGASTAPQGAAVHACATRPAGVGRLRSSGVPCGTAAAVVAAWKRQRDCAPAGGASRSGCAVRSYRCAATVTGRGISASCARRGRSIAFDLPRG